MTGDWCVEQRGSYMSLMKSRIKPPVLVHILIMLAVIISLLASCKSRPAILKEKWEKNPCTRIGYWGEEWKKTPLNQRIKEAPAELIEKIQIENEFQGFKERPSSVKPPPELFEAMKSVEASMPDNLEAILNERLIGIFAVREVGGTGYADAVYDSEGNEKYGLIVLDVDVLMRKKANEWATWKENSIFRPKADGKVKLKAVVEEEENDTVVNAVRYIILHEMGHILGMISKAHSSWIDWFAKKKIRMDYPFQRLSWKLTQDNQAISLFDDKFPERRSIKVYSFEKSKLSNEQIPMTFNRLQKHTNFPSLHAGQSLWEDFAESFVMYFHVVIDKRPWQIIIEQKDQPQIVVESCWEQERCRRKKEYMERWFENPLTACGSS